MADDIDNRRETGGRIFPRAGKTADKRAGIHEETSQDASLPKPKKPFGLTRPVDETDDETHQSDGVDGTRAYGQGST